MEGRTAALAPTPALHLMRIRRSHSTFVRTPATHNCALHVIGKPRLQTKSSTLRRMDKLQLGGMERQPHQSMFRPKDPIVFTLAIVDVTDDRTRKVFEMSPNLMKATGARGSVHERVAPKRFESLKLRDGVDARSLRSFGNGIVQHQMVGRMAPGQSEVRLFDLPARERRGHFACHLYVEREHDQSGRSAIESMDGMNIGPYSIPYELEKRVPFADPSSMHDQTTGLFYDDKSIVLIHEFYRGWFK